MLAAAGLAFALIPHQKTADHGTRIDLEKMIPKQFGDWKTDDKIIPLQINPEVEAKLNKIYNQTLSRTYINNKGDRVMLSIAYGSDQSDSMQVHRPEVCYPAQGFQVIRKSTSQITIDGKTIPVRQLVAQQGNRFEPITYWITVGNKAVAGGLDRKLAQIRYGLTGTIPDGMLIRISSISTVTESAYDIQTTFIRQMGESTTPATRDRLFGASKSTKEN